MTQLGQVRHSNGNLRHPVFASRAKEYVWDLLCEVFPRGITPTDIDGVVELNRLFFCFEGKLQGVRVPTGQGLALRRMVEAWPAGTAVVVVGEHARSERVDVFGEVTRVDWGWKEPSGCFGWVGRHDGPACVWAVATMFVEDAQAGGLRCDSWAARLVELGRPFE